MRMSILTPLMKYMERLPPWLLARRGIQRRYVQTDHGPIHLFDGPGRGDGPPLLLLHGLGSRAADYGLLMSRLRRHTRRLIAPDIPGHGSSPLPPGGLSIRDIESALLQTVDQVLDEPAIVIGNSMGGFAAVRLAGARPERTRALVLASPGGAPEPALDVFLQRFDLQTAADARQFMDRCLGRRRLGQSLLAAGVQGRMLSAGPRHLVSQVSPDDMLQPEELSSLAMPILMVWGREDEVLRRSHLAFFRRHLPAHATITTPPRVGHVPYLDDISGFVRLIERFLATL